MGRPRKETSVENPEAAPPEQAERHARKAKSKLMDNPTWGKVQAKAGGEGNDNSQPKKQKKKKGNDAPKSTRKSTKESAGSANAKGKRDAQGKQTPGAPTRPIIDAQFLDDDTIEEQPPAPLPAKEIKTRGPRVTKSKPTPDSDSQVKTAQPVQPSAEAAKTTSKTGSVAKKPLKKSRKKDLDSDTQESDRTSASEDSEESSADSSDLSEDECPQAAILESESSGSEYSDSEEGEDDDEGARVDNLDLEDDDREVIETSTTPCDPAGKKAADDRMNAVPNKGEDSDALKKSGSGSSTSHKRTKTRNRASSVSSPPPKKRKKSHVPSAAEDAANKRERPTFVKQPTVGNVKDAQQAEEEEEAHPDTLLVYKKKTQINKTSQPAKIEALIEAMIVACQKDFIGTQAAWASTADRVAHQREILEAVARDHGEEAIADRIFNDKKYAATYLRTCDGRVKLLRGKMREFAASAIAAEYEFSKQPSKEARKALVDELLRGVGYAYPGDAMKVDGLDGKAPFKREIFPNILRKFFFKDGSGTGSLSLAAEAKDHFASSLPSAPSEPEIPVPLVAIVCAVIALALQDWTHGVAPQKASPFRMASAYKEYKVVIDMMADTKRDSPKSFHRIMHDLFVASSGYTPIISAEKQKDHDAAVQGSLRRLTVRDD